MKSGQPAPKGPIKGPNRDHQGPAGDGQATAAQAAGGAATADGQGRGGGSPAGGPARDQLDGSSDLKPKELFHIRETKLCTELNISKDALRARRTYFLVQGRHWDYVNKRVLLSAIGAEILRGTKTAALPDGAEALGSPTVDSERPGAKIKPLALLPEKNPPPVPFTGKLITHAMPVRNERLLVCYVPGTDPSNPLNLVSVHVRSNRNFLVGMELPGPGRQVHQISDSVYELQGACPRGRGRW